MPSSSFFGSAATAPEAAAPKRSPKRAVPPAADGPLEVRIGIVALLPELRARALRLCGDAATAEDVVQDTMERALRFSSQYRYGTNLRAWAFQVLFSVFVTRWRRRRRDRKAIEHLASDPSAWPHRTDAVTPELGEKSLTPSVLRKLDALPDGFRSVVVMVDIEDRSYRDVAHKLGVPIGTVMSRLHRGRKWLADELRSDREAA